MMGFQVRFISFVEGQIDSSGEPWATNFRFGVTPMNFTTSHHHHHLHFEVILHHLATNLRLSNQQSVFSQRGFGGEQLEKVEGGCASETDISKGNVRVFGILYILDNLQESNFNFSAT